MSPHHGNSCRHITAVSLTRPSDCRAVQAIPRASYPWGQIGDVPRGAGRPSGPPGDRAGLLELGCVWLLLHRQFPVLVDRHQLWESTSKALLTPARPSAPAEREPYSVPSIPRRRRRRASPLLRSRAFACRHLADWFRTLLPAFAGRGQDPSAPRAHASNREWNRTLLALAEAEDFDPAPDSVRYTWWWLPSQS